MIEALLANAGTIGGLAGVAVVVIMVAVLGRRGAAR